jgi:transposase
MDQMETPPRVDAAPIFAGIAVSKARLDVALRPSGEHWCSPNDEAGIAELVTRRRPRAPQLLVVEATGGLERPVVVALALAGWPLAVVNPPRDAQRDNTR